MGVLDNFFDLGGHSLLATRVVSKLRDIFRVEIPMRRIFEKPTVKGVIEILADLLGGMDTVEQIALLYEQVECLTENEVKEMMTKLANQ